MDNFLKCCTAASRWCDILYTLCIHTKFCRPHPVSPFQSKVKIHSFGCPSWQRFEVFHKICLPFKSFRRIQMYCPCKCNFMISQIKLLLHCMNKHCYVLKAIQAVSEHKCSAAHSLKCLFYLAKIKSFVFSFVFAVSYTIQSLSKNRALCIPAQQLFIRGDR